MTNSISFEKYREICSFLDQYCARTLKQYIQAKAIKEEDIVISSAVLIDNLRSCQSPNYDSVELPVAYNLQYLPRRIMTMIGVLDYLYSDQKIDEIPKKFLDIGSGSDAVSIALGTYFSMVQESQNIHVTALEPSQSMIDIAQCKPSEWLTNIEIKHDGGVRIEDLVIHLRKYGHLKKIIKEIFDLITISASLPYEVGGKDIFDIEDEWWTTLFMAIKLLLKKKTGICIVVEPENKIKRIFGEERFLKIIESLLDDGWYLTPKPLDEMSAVSDPIRKFVRFSEMSQIQDQYFKNYREKLRQLRSLREVTAMNTDS